MSWPVLSYAFVLGMVATVNPCGFALRPVYLTALPGSTQAGPGGSLSQVPRAVLAGLGATAGFLAVVAVVGALVSAGVSAIMAWVPELGIAVGAALVVVGGLTAAGRHLGLRLPGATRPLGGRRLRSMIGFGVSYASASLGCSLPVFLAGVAGAFTRGGVGEGLGAFVAYALGMGAVLTALAVAYALVPARRLGRLRAVGGRLERPVGILLAEVGGYLVYYWSSDLAGAQATSGVAGTLDRIDAALTSAISAAGPLLGAVVVGVLVALQVRGRSAESRGSRQSEAAENPDASPKGVARPLRNRWPRRAGARLVLSALAAILAAAALPALVINHPETKPVPAPSVALTRLLGLDSLDAQSVFPAPGFTLTDQAGQLLSLASLRGKAVVLVFFDNHCQELCPLFSQDVRAAAADLGSLARRVAFVAVNVNPFYPEVRYDVAFDRRVGVDTVRDWYFLTGPLPALEAVWRAYGAQPITGPDQSVEHTSVIDFIDPEGKIRDVGSYGPSSADSARWGYGLATMAEDLLGTHRPLAARVSLAAPASRAGTAPGFSLPALNADAPTTVSLEALRGRPVVLNFFATWCSACQAEAAGLAGEARKLGAEARFVGIDVDGSRAAAAGFVRHYGIGYPVAVDHSGSVAAAYGATGLPTTVFISASGQEVGRQIGAISPGLLAADVAKLRGAG